MRSNRRRSSPRLTRLRREARSGWFGCRAPSGLNCSETGRPSLSVRRLSILYRFASSSRFTTWQDEFAGRFNKFLIPATTRNGLRTDSAADFLQVRSVSTERLMRRVGVLEADEVEEIAAGIVIAVDYRP